MTYKEVHELANGQVGPYCKNCDICDGRACANSMPGPGCKFPGNTAKRNYDKWQEICVNMDTLCERFNPDISFELFGRKFSAPVFPAPLGSIDMHYGPKYRDIEYNGIMLEAACECGLMGFTGDGVDPEITKHAVADMTKLDGIGCPTIKPWNKETIFEKLDILNENGIFCTGMDIDAAGLPFLKAMNPNAGSKTVDEMKEIVSYAKMPFIIKGIMTVEGALKAVDTGAAGIVVSNHGGRVQGGCPSTAEVLSGIAEAVKGKITIFVDGGIRSGLDVFRAIGLGADAVLIGRPVLNCIYGAGKEGFTAYMDKITGELKSTMSMCGTPSLEDISAKNLYV